MKSVDWFLDSGHLVRRVIPARGKPYSHRVRFDDFSAIAYSLGEMKDGFTLFDLAADAFGRDDETGEPLYTTRASVALNFAIECSLVDRCGRGNVLCPGFDPLVLLADMHGLHDRVYSNAG